MEELVRGLGSDNKSHSDLLPMLLADIASRANRHHWLTMDKNYPRLDNTAFTMTRQCEALKALRIGTGP